ncbi:DUF6090 family protein [Winogradskyella sp. A2]|uniref:DUF6090 family protein n=1 Tax=Winogradskyella sp. A2 TaxID=3366944 RepID=UPI00398C5253
MEQNKTGKYVKYAIGEIILVVIGILIALQINNWNNNRIDSKREANYILNIERDLYNQIEAIDIQIAFESKIADYTKSALAPYRETNNLIMDSTLAKAIGTINSRRTFLNPNPTYTELISSGNIELIKNESLKTELINYYQETERIELIMANNNTLFTDQQFSPIMMRFGISSSEEDWENMFNSYQNKYSSGNPLSPKNMLRLSQISTRLLQDEANELLFVNHLSEREGYAINHIFLLTELKVRTNKILKSIKTKI